MELLGFERGDQIVQVAFHHPVEFMQGDAGAMIADTILRIVIRTNFFAAFTASNLGPPMFRNGRFLFFPFRVPDTGSKRPHGFGPVF